MTTIPFNEAHEEDAAEYLAEQLRLRGHDARHEYLGSNTSLIVTLSTTREALLVGWGDLEGWRAEFDQYSTETGMLEREYDTATEIPDSQMQDIDRLALVLNQFLSGVYPEGYGPRTGEVRPIAERRAYNDICNQMYGALGEMVGQARELDTLTEEHPYVVLTDYPEVKAALDAASDAIDVAYRLMEVAHVATTHLYGRYPAYRRPIPAR